MRGIPAWAAFLLLGLLACAGFLLTTSIWLKATVSFGVTTLSMVLVARAYWSSRSDRRHDPVLPVLVVGAVLYLLGSLGWWCYPLVTGRPLPAPSVVDALYFCAYAAVGVFLVLLGRRNRVSDPKGALDALIIALGLLPAGYLALMDPLSGLGRNIGLAQASFLAYPMFVGLLVSLGIWVAFVAARSSVPYVLLMGWLGSELLGDVIYGRTGATGTFSYGQPWQVLWVLSMACLGALALHPGLLSLTAPSSRPAGRARLRLVVLGAALAAPSVTMLYVEVWAHNESVLLLSMGTTLVLIVLVCLRLSSLMTDLDAQRRLLAELDRLSTDLSHQVLHDPLTGLGNRVMLRDRLQLALAQRAVAADRGAAVLLLDLDDFKTVNDSLGHDAGDVVLVEVARRLAGTARHGETVCRLGGDEFAFVLSHASLQDALRLADRIRLSLTEVMVVGAREIRPTASIGISVALRGQDRTGVLAEADIAMYAAKRGTTNRIAVFDPVLHRVVLERHQFENDLGGARARGELRVLYQPLVHLASNEMVGVESLVRWEHPTRGTVSPVEFIPLAELSGAILDIGDWVLQETCRQAAIWDASAPSHPLRVSVNVSPRQLDDPDFTGRAGAIIKDSGLDPARITLEVTEAALGTNTETMILRLRQLKKLGVMLAIDDFGTGYSSLSHLRRLPVDILKIDKSFVAGIARDPAEWALTTAIVRLAASLGKSTVAEGIETGGQLAHLRSLHVDHGQGYLFSRPVADDEIASLLRAVPGEAFLVG